VCPPEGAATVSCRFGDGRIAMRDRQTDGGSIPPSSTTDLGLFAQVRGRFGAGCSGAATRARHAISSQSRADPVEGGDDRSCFVEVVDSDWKVA
jgi:hypothetical protein